MRTDFTLTPQARLVLRLALVFVLLVLLFDGPSIGGALMGNTWGGDAMPDWGCK